ncbi:sensor domain-containing diguanylate cyclase [Stenotrophomonas sp. 24(2023)]|uniref:sensor domain-containing diguanylate cyclase n=1 Tax=Stenotrophomonas sp. 24(2023) TaxID=3068324 RepID=UPI0027DFB60B|nr:sensor domain-containing diguanylate cyclase [Stenotrophomonas sp. 24(2023)]WMJ68209.1 diguanylate cyclase [Stenotrophomonas sp. 24(2023)]
MPFFTDSTETAGEGRGAARRIGWMRFVGNGLGTLPIASIILERHDGLLPWVLLLLNAVVWPAIALVLIHRSREPAAAQFRCMVLDSGFGGAWIAFMALSTVPSALFAALLVADKIAAGGVRLALRATLALVLGFAVAWLALGFPYQPMTSQRTILLSLPFLFVYGIGLSLLSWRLARRVKSQNRQLQRLSRMDPLVELANRGYLIRRAQQVLDQAHQQGGVACLLMLDVDDFKQINDAHGHRAGDEVLRHVASTLRAFVRPGDIPARLGGDEFVVLLGACSAADAMRVAGDIRQWLHVARSQGAVVVGYSVSIGIAATPQHGTVEDWLAMADKALYHAKRQGKDTASCAE